MTRWRRRSLKDGRSWELEKEAGFIDCMSNYRRDYRMQKMRKDSQNYSIRPL